MPVVADLFFDSLQYRVVFNAEHVDLIFISLPKLKFIKLMVKFRLRIILADFYLLQTHWV